MADDLEAAYRQWIAILKAAFPPEIRKRAEAQRAGRPKKFTGSVQESVRNAVLDQRLIDYRKNGSTIEWMAQALGISESKVDRRFAKIAHRARVKEYLRKRRARAYLRYRQERQ